MFEKTDKVSHRLDLSIERILLDPLHRATCAECGVSGNVVQVIWINP
jgi:hypothetical protein